MGERTSPGLRILAFSSAAGSITVAQSSLRWLSLSVPAAWVPPDLPITIAFVFFAIGNVVASPVAQARRAPALAGVLSLFVSAIGIAAAAAFTAPGGAIFLGLFALLGLLLGVASRTLVGQGQLLLCGALAGTLIASAIQLANLGASAGLWLGAAVLASGGLLGLNASGVRLDPSRSVFSPAPAGLAKTAALLSGALLASQLAWTMRVLEPYSGNSIHTGGALLATALCGLNLGFAAHRRFGPTSAGSHLGLSTLAAAGALTAFALYPQLEWSLPGIVERLGGLWSWQRALALVIGENLLLVLPVAIALGAAWESLVRRAPTRWAWIGVGAAIASWTLPNALTAFGSTTAACAWIGAILVFTGLASLATRSGSQRWLPVTVTFALLLCVLYFARSPLDHHPFAQRYGTLVGLKQFAQRTLLITTDSERGRMLRERTGQPLGGVGTDTQDRVAAQLALLAHRAPSRVLQLDFGVGNGASSILAHPVERLDVADPQGVARQTAEFFEESNLGVITDERIVLHETSAWTLLAQSSEQWDLILLTATTLEGADREQLPTTERLRLLKEHLAPGGVVSIALNLGRISDEEARTIMRTALAGFDHGNLWEGPLGYVWIMNLSDSSPAVYFPTQEQQRRLPDLAAELDWLDLATPSSLRERFVMDALPFAGHGPLVTAEHPRVDVTSALSPLTFYGLGAAAADTPLADATTAERRENTGLALLFTRMEDLRALERGKPPPLEPRSPEKQ